MRSLQSSASFLFLWMLSPCFLCSLLSRQYAISEDKIDKWVKFLFSKYSHDISRLPDKVMLLTGWSASNNSGNFCALEACALDYMNAIQRIFLFQPSKLSFVNLICKFCLRKATKIQIVFIASTQPWTHRARGGFEQFGQVLNLNFRIFVVTIFRYFSMLKISLWKFCFVAKMQANCCNP